MSAALPFERLNTGRHEAQEEESVEVAFKRSIVTTFETEEKTP